MKELNKFEIYNPEEFVLSQVFDAYTIESRKLVSDLLTKVYQENIKFSIKVRKNKEFAMTLSDNYTKNIATIWPWEDYIQILVLGETNKKVNCYCKEDITEELIAKIYKKYCDRCTPQIKLDI